MTARTILLIAAAGSAALLGGAFIFQMFGYAPCKLCLWQRWPHGAAIVLGALVFAFGPRVYLAALGALAALTTAWVGLYHVAVEQKWVEGPTGCTGFDISNLSADELMDAINAAPLVRCDEITWQLMGVSMAGWNAVISLGLAAIWIYGARQLAR